MSDDQFNNKYKVKFGGPSIEQTQLDPALQRVLRGLGFVTVSQLYAQMKVSPDALAELVKDFGVTYAQLTQLVNQALAPADKTRIDEESAVEYATGQLGATDHSNGSEPDIISRDE